MSSPTPIVSPPANSQPVPATNSTLPPPSTPSAQPPLQPPASSSPLPAIRTSPPPSSTPTTPEATPPASSYSHPPPSNPTSPSKPGSSASPPPPSRTNSPPSKTPTTPGRSSPPPPKASGLPPLDSNNLSTGVVVVGVAIGAIAILLILSILCICCAKKKRRRRDEEAYYMPPHPRPKRKALAFGGPPRRLQHNAPLPSDCVVKMMPKPSPLQPVASRPQQSPMYVPPPSPPKPCTNSGAGFGSNYSGSSNILPPPPPPPPLPCYLLGFSNSTFTFEELALATDGFSDANLLGQGGFGYVHKGVLPNGKEIAVKQLKAGSGQGECEFQAEVEIISRVHHRHLVSLVGYCMSGYQRMLVYEFVPNNNLEFHLHGKGRPTMDFPTRLKIALGSAKGLAYLHEDCHPKIIHRDIKASNILLDFKFEVKVADFGLARITSDANTHVSTRVMGTFGYLAPEYASSGKLTDKSDVFSFGVMLLELITGRLPVDASQSLMEDSIVYWARPLLNRALDRNFDGLVDPRLQNDYDPNEMSCMVACAVACVRHSARLRPRMSQIVRALEGDMSLCDLVEGIGPRHSNTYSSYGSSDYDTSQYNDLKKFRKTALGSKEYGVSNKYDGPTSEYGLYPSDSSGGEAQTSNGDGKVQEKQPRFQGKLLT